MLDHDHLLISPRNDRILQQLDLHLHALDCVHDRCLRLLARGSTSQAETIYSTAFLGIEEDMVGSILPTLRTVEIRDKKEN